MISQGPSPLTMQHPGWTMRSMKVTWPPWSKTGTSSSIDEKHRNGMYIGYLFSDSNQRQPNCYIRRRLLKAIPPRISAMDFLLRTVWDDVRTKLTMTGA